jgi:hypothetical protein
MIKIIKNEFKKYSNSYINFVSFAAMLFPILFTAPIYYFTDNFTFAWHAYITSLHLFYGIFLGSLIPSFIAIFSIYYEFKEGTMKNLLTSPHSRIQIIVSKMLYVSIFVIGLYIAAALLVLFSGMIIGLNTSFIDAINTLQMIIIPGMITIVLVPMMIFLTLVFKNFVVPVIIAFLGTVIGIPIINLGKSYFYPWMLPSNFFFRLSTTDSVNFIMPIVTFILFFGIFFILSIIRFKKMNFDN